MDLKEKKCWKALTEALDSLRAAKPDERSEEARRYAVAITELEKVVAYYDFFVLKYLVK